MSEEDNALAIYRAMQEREAAQQALNNLGRTRSNESVAGELIDTRDAAERKVEEKLGTVSADTRKTLMETFVEQNPKSEYAANLAAYVRNVDGN